MSDKPMKKTREERLEALLNKTGSHKSGLHLYGDSRTAKKSRKNRFVRNRREAQLNTLKHRLWYQLQDEKKR